MCSRPPRRAPLSRVFAATAPAPAPKEPCSGGSMRNLPATSRRRLPVTPPNDAAFLDRLAGAVRGLAKAEARGDLANLRRLDLQAPASPSFYRLLARHAPDAH